jgi:proteasome lid subunit RPN8/RPN11
MYLLKIAQLQKLVNHIELTKPSEASGLILAKNFEEHILLSFIETSSEENTMISFRIRDKEIKEIAHSIEGSGLRICGCFHSHILGPARPSYFDGIAPKTVGDLWLIYSVRFLDFNIFSWDGNAFHKERFRLIK